MSGAGKPCVFFDRDGVVNRSPGDGYVLSPDVFELNPGIAEALCLLRQKGVLAIVVTSQKCVGKRLVSRQQLDAIHRRMADLLAASGAAFDAVSSHLGDGSPDDPAPKPDPDMIHRAAEKFGIDPRQSWIIGDADRDIAMGQAAGLLGTIRIRGDKPIGIPADHTLDSTMEISALLQKLL